MNRSIPMLLIGLVFGGLTGFLLAAGYGVTLDGHDHDHNAAPSSNGTSHAHDDALRIEDGEIVPSVDVRLHADPAGGWNIQVLTNNFRFSPERVSRDHVAGEGHAHAYLNGVKIARLYSAWMQLPSVESGDVISVGLYSNDHKALAVGQKAIVAYVTIP